MGSEQGWQRPALVISSDQWNRHASTLTVVPLTRRKHGLPTRAEIEADQPTGLDVTSYAHCEDIRSVSDRRLVHRLGEVDLATMIRVARTLRMFLEV